MKKSLILASLLVCSISFSGCGGSDNNLNSSSIAPVTTKTPVTTKVVCDPKKVIADNNDTYDIKYAAEGDINVTCKKTYGEYQLVTDVNTLTITNMIKVTASDINRVKAKGEDIETYDYKAGTIHYQVNGTLEGKTFKYDCIETYTSPLPTTLTDTSSIRKLFNWDDNENNRIKTTCPSSFYEEDNNTNDNFGKGTINNITNYTLIDNNGKKHLITESLKMTFN